MSPKAYTGTIQKSGIDRRYSSWTLISYPIFSGDYPPKLGYPDDIFQKSVELHRIRYQISQLSFFSPSTHCFSKRGDTA
jgi:hypothetical protein